MNTASLPDGPQNDRQTRQVQWGDTVRVDFLTWLDDGTVIDSSIYSEPLIFTTGTGSVMQGIENLVIGMSVGDSKSERIPPDSAFGPYRQELSCQVSRSWLQVQDVTPVVGLGLEVRKTDGTLVPMIITGLDGDRVTLDANHQFAGKNFVVQLDLLEILDQSGSGMRTTPTPAA
jgi:peptidylprolyl isomerase